MKLGAADQPRLIRASAPSTAGGARAPTDDAASPRRNATRHIVYFAYLGDEGSDGGLVRQRLAYMERQLAWLAALVPQGAPVLVPYVAPRAWDGEVHRAVERHGFTVDPASIAAERRNTFEYRGFAALKALAEASDPATLLYYCHSKGIVHLEEPKMGLFRLHTEVGLTADLSRLVDDPALTRAALFPYRFGWCWYNFFWIKAARMASLPVEESADRYHFEALIGDRGDKEGYRGVLPLIGQVPVEHHGIAAQPWYRPDETTNATLVETYARYAGMAAPGRDQASMLTPTDALTSPPSTAIVSPTT